LPDAPITPALPSVEGPAPAPAALSLGGSIGPANLTTPETLAQRKYEQRVQLVEKMGGTKESEAAVAASLAYLVKNQEPDGRWTRIANERGRGTRDEHDVAITSLAALCFLASDHTPAREGPYQDAVRKAIDYLISRQARNGDLRGDGNMYDHGMATIALGEAAQMTGDERYRAAALRAADFIVQAQNDRDGGWRYAPGDSGDTSVLGWQLMGLHSAQRVGFQIPPQTLRGAAKWIDNVSSGKNKIIAKYFDGRLVTATMTAEALFCRTLLGQHPSEAAVAEAAEMLMAESPDKPRRVNFYGMYYSSLALMQFQGDAWNRWNTATRNWLTKNQRRGGPLDGSWDPADRWGDQGGRIYSTALCTLTLEVYYRYLPMYGAGSPP
jgi:hypothetical protein